MGNKQISASELPEEERGHFIWTEGKRLAKNRHRPLADVCAEGHKIATATGRRVFIVEVIGCIQPKILLPDRIKILKEAEKKE